MRATNENSSIVEPSEDAIAPTTDDRECRIDPTITAIFGALDPATRMPPGYVPGVSRRFDGERYMGEGPRGMQSEVLRADAVPNQSESRSTGDNANSWGRSASLTAQSSASELIRVQLERGESLTLTLAVPQPPLSGTAHDATVALTVWFKVVVGGGSTSIQRLVRGDDYLSIPLVATFVSVSAYVGNLAGDPVASVDFSSPPNTAQVSAFLVRGVRGIPGQATNFSSQTGNAFQATPGPVRLASISAHLTATAGAEQFLQLFDVVGLPGVGDAPYAEWALGENPENSGCGNIVRFLNPIGCSQGAYFVVSTTSGEYAISAAEAFVSYEIVLL